MRENKTHRPPAFSAFLLNWLVSDHFNTPQGDFEEFFNEIANERGVQRARWWYRGQVIRLIPDQLYEKVYWGIVMLKNYFLVGSRNLIKNKVATTINIVGLSAAVGSAIALMMFVFVLNDYDQFHEHKDELYLISHSLDPVSLPSGAKINQGTSPIPLGPEMAESYSQIERSVRFSTHSAQVRSGEHSYSEHVSYADPGFFEALSFPLFSGSTSALDDPSSVILSADMAAKYFREEDPVGKELFIANTEGSERFLKVGGVAEKFPESASLTFDFLMGFDHRPSKEANNPLDWSSFADVTIVQIKNPQDVQFLERELNRYVGVANQAGALVQIESFFLDSVGNPNWMSAWQIEGRAMEAPRPVESAMFAGLAVLMLLVSCFNYITISLGSAARRLKEIGIRKTTGAERGQLTIQFLSENLLICLVAMIGGVLFAWSAAIPFINSRVLLDIPPGYFSDPMFWSLLVGLLLFIGLVSGSYPAFYISSFQPVEILRGTRTLGEKKGLMRVLTTSQFVLTIITIMFATFVGSLDEKLKIGDWGYDPDTILVLPVSNLQHFDQLQQEASRMPSVTRVAGTLHHIGKTATSVEYQVEAENSSAFFFNVGPGYLTALGGRLSEGRDFDQVHVADDSASVVVNKTFAEQHKWESAIGQQVRIGDRLLSVVGVVDDVLLSPLKGKAEPVIFSIAAPSAYKSMIVQVQQGGMQPTVASLRSFWESEFPELDFSYFPQTEAYDAESMRGLSSFMKYISLFALLIAGMGLFGLASQRVAMRMKEVGVRKVMGASNAHIIFVVNREFLVMLGVASLIATPLCYIAFSNTILQFTAVDIPNANAPLIIANLVVFVVAALSISMQSYRLVHIPPADVLRAN